jgi:predicted MPP superfamily phosphohydrolase
MRRVAHLSDLHFGRIEPGVLEVLRRRLAALAPDLLVISGDLTQRAKSGEFRQARAYLDTLPRPQIVVPGNHDVPLYNVLRRFFRPLAGYRRFVGEDLEPSYIDEEIAVVGMNTARALAFKGGGINAAQIADVRRKICRLGDEVTKLLVMHHPFDVPQLADCGIDVLMAGHLHTSRVAMTALSVLVVQAGTATSRRTREEPNSFNLLRLEPRHIEVDRYELQGDDFVRSATEAFQRGAGGWLRSAPSHAAA